MKKYKRSTKNITNSNYIRSQLPSYVFKEGPCDHKNNKGNLTFYIDYMDSRKVCCSKCDKKFESYEALKIDSECIELEKALKYCGKIHLPVKLKDLPYDFKEI